MRSCLIVGSGRSGTSMLGGVLAGGGFHMGTQPLPGDFRPESNAKGMFEDRETIAINEDLLAQLFPPEPRTRIARFRRRGELEKGLRWAAVLPPGAEVESTPELNDQVLEGSAIGEIQVALGAELDVGFTDPGLKRSPSEGPVGEAERALYSELCELASYRAASSV